MRGRKLTGLAAAWDWYSTFAELAGADPTDHRAAAAKLPAIDSISLWPYLSGQVPESPRRILPIGSTTCGSGTNPMDCVDDWGWGDVKTVVAGMIVDERHFRSADDTITTTIAATTTTTITSNTTSTAITSSSSGKTSSNEGGLWKLLLGSQTMDGWQGPVYPNASTAHDAFTFTPAFIHKCGAGGCFFRLDTDPSEHNDLLAAGDANATILAQVAAVMDKLRAANASAFSPERGPGEADPKVIDAACKVALSRYGGFFGPFLNL